MIGNRIHRGNTAVNTEGCILVGQSAGQDVVTQSEAALTEMTNYIQNIQNEDSENDEETTITVEVEEAEDAEPQ